MKYDDASWHYGGDFPADLPQAAGGTHIAMFVVWCWLNGLGGEDFIEGFPDALEAAKARIKTPFEIFSLVSDEKFIDDDLNEEGNAFALFYYGAGGEMKAYLSDYEAAVAATLPSTYHVPDTWQTYDKLAPVILRRFKAWQSPQKSWLEKLWPNTKR